jgi:hypothetical protein
MGDGRFHDPTGVDKWPCFSNALGVSEPCPVNLTCFLRQGELTRYPFSIWTFAKGALLVHFESLPIAVVIRGFSK